MKRFAALLLALGMVFGSLTLRNSMDASSTDSNKSGGGNSAGSADEFRLTCASDLELVCAKLAETNSALSVTIELPGTTADSLTSLADGADPGFDAWLTVGPWAEIVQDNRSFAGNPGAILGETSAVLGSSPAQILTLNTQEQRLKDACGGAITWKCLGANPSLPQPQSVGMESPDTGAGLAVLADATNSYFGSSDYSATDFEDAAFIGWFEQLTKKSRNSDLGRQTVLVRALTAAGTYTTVGALRSQVESLKSGTGKYNVIAAPKDAPAQPVVAQVRLVPARGVDTNGALDRVDREALTTLLKESNWNVSPKQPDSNMPAAGVLQVLRDMWEP